MTEAPPTDALLEGREPLEIPPGIEGVDLAEHFSRLLLRASLLDGKVKRVEREAREEQRELLGALVAVDDALAALALDRELVALGRGEGIEATRRMLLGRLAKAEVKPMRLDGREADPRTAEIVGAEARPGVEPETVVRTVVTGFFWRDEVLRRAQVVVAAAPDAEPESVEPESVESESVESESVGVAEPDPPAEPVRIEPPGPPAAARVRRAQPRARSRAARKHKK
ncbi:nucleotide exchange factor GrpE [Kitasatospora sp. NPDC101183]|uniref:nucleotide exchange factor GrpE n=1 Tax=Kitasatospora sp. NPDC101183 TaxID=3364100 RepID=UPI003815E7D5